MEELDFHGITIQPVFSAFGTKKKVSVSVLRLDLLHPVISGNKWFKLRYYFDEIKHLNKKRIVTFGGPFSNHIAATAGMCALINLQSIAIVRGEEPRRGSTTLNAAMENGMEIIYQSRTDYKNKSIPININEENDYIIPEGGYGIKGAEGFATALEYCNKKDYTHIACAVGTGTMMAGVIKASEQEQQILGVSVLKSNYNILPEIKQLLTTGEQQKDICIFSDYSFGGYAKHKPELFDFMNSFYAETAIPSDFVYTGKLFFAVNDLLQKDYFPPGSKVLLIHSGGLQGNNSLKKSKVKFLTFL